MRNFSRLYTSTALCVSIISLAALPAAAQTANNETAEADGEDNVIIVTARKREEGITDVPLSVSAIGGEDLEGAGIESLEDVANFTPGLTFQEFNGGGLGSPAIRGLAQTDIASFNNNVGVFLDGVFISSKANLDVSLFDLDRVEVTRGPQSALYGNNSFAGAINYVTSRSTDDFKAKFSATIGTDERYEINGSVSGPLIDGVLGARLNAGYQTFDGTINNLFSSDNLGGYDHKISVSGALDLDPSEDFSATLFLYYGDEALDGSAAFINLNNCGGPNSLMSGVITGRGGTINRYYCGDLQRPDEVTVSPLAFSERESFFGYLSAELDLGPATIKSLTSFGDYSADALSDQELNATTLPQGTRRAIRPFIGDAKDFSQEIRIESYDNGPFDWALGAYYIDRELQENFQTGSFDVLLGGPGVLQLNRFQGLDAEAFSVFGLVGFNIGDSFNISGEGRYTSDKQQFNRSQSFFGAPPTVGTANDTFKYFTYRVTADYKISDDSLIYGSLASGAKSGGFNVTADPTESSFGEESNTTFELGFKQTFDGGNGYFNIAGFYVDWSDVQIPVPSTIAGNANVTQNFGDASAKGIEAELFWNIGDNTNIRLGYAYSDATFDDGTEDLTAGRRCATPADCGSTAGPNGGVLVGGNRLPRSAAHQLNGSFVQNFPIGSGNIYLRGDFSHQSERFSTPLNLQSDGGRTLVNARFGVELDQGFDISIWANNLFDEKYVNSSINEPEFFPSSTFTTGFLANGQTLGLTFRFTK